LSLTRRHLTATAVLAAVFASGWYLGQPVKPAECVPRPRQYSDHLEAVSCDPADDKPRILAWLTGDFR
jgi:hypothetical protein